MDQYLAYLDRLDCEDLRRRMVSFENQVWANPDADVTSAMTMDVFLPTGGGSAFFPISTPDPLPVGSRFWRARSLNGIGELRTEADLWEPPAPVTSAGRLNAAGEPLLYTTLNDPLGIEEEARISSGQAYMLTRFRATAPIRTVSLRQLDMNSHLSASQQSTHELIIQFLVAQMFRPATISGAHKVSQAFWRDIYNLPPDLYDGWVWDSVAARGAVNVALRPQAAHDRLTVDRVYLYQRENGTRRRIGAIDLDAWTDRLGPPPSVS